jgi:hypothetical protein
MQCAFKNAKNVREESFKIIDFSLQNFLPYAYFIVDKFIIRHKSC